MDNKIQPQQNEPENRYERVDFTPKTDGCSNYGGSSWTDIVSSNKNNKKSGKAKRLKKFKKSLAKAQKQIKKLAKQAKENDKILQQSLSKMSKLAKEIRDEKIQQLIDCDSAVGRQRIAKRIKGQVF